MLTNTINNDTTNVTTIGAIGVIMALSSGKNDTQ